MAASAPPSIETRLATLEQQIQELRTRLGAIERVLSNPSEHPTDQSTVRKKVTYDWQA